MGVLSIDIEKPSPELDDTAQRLYISNWLQAADLCTQRVHESCYQKSHAELKRLRKRAFTLEFTAFSVTNRIALTPHKWSNWWTIAQKEH